MKYAVCALIVQNQQVLAVSRKDNHKDMGLIGGKVDGCETCRQSLHREVKEETGLEFSDKDCRLIFSSMDGPFMVLTYYIKNYSGEINTTETGLVKFVDYDEIISEDASFKNYNLALLEQIFKYND